MGDSIAIDGIGNAYVTGYASSTNFPTTPGAFQTSLGTGASYNAFITKLNPAGSSLIYSTYLGGDIEDYGNGIAIDGSGNVYVTGLASSLNFPTTPDAYQKSLGGSGATNAFIAKFNLNTGFFVPKKRPVITKITPDSGPESGGTDCHH